MNKKTKFKNISAINSYINMLYKSFGSPLIPDFKTNLLIGNRYFHNNIVIYTQNIAKQIANHFGLNITHVIVTFVNKLGVPGKVILSSGNTFFVEIDTKYQSNTNFISAILAHEIAHIYLFRKGLMLNDTYSNELLTDTTACFVGCANLILNSSYDEVSFLGNQTTVHSFGYITQYEVGYILAKRDFLLQQNSSEMLIYGRSKEFYEEGKAYFLKSLRRPYVKRSSLGNLAYWIKAKFKAGSIIFNCICCDQQIRISANNKILSVYCPTCNNSLLCYS